MEFSGPPEEPREELPGLGDVERSALQPKATVTLITGERHMTLESYEEVKEAMEEDHFVELQTFRDFSTTPGQPDNEPFRLGTQGRYIICVTEITARLFQRHMEAIKRQAEEVQKQPSFGVFEIPLGPQ